jgi:hypothetical protein
VSPLLAPTKITALQAFNLGLAQTYQQGFGDPTVRAVYPLYTAYVQDSWKATRNLTLSAGVRYEADQRKPPLPTNKLNFGPRFGFASERFFPCHDSQSEINDLQNSFIGDEEVGWLDIPVDDAASVRIGEARRGLNRELNSLCTRDIGAASLPFQSLTFEERHRQEGVALGFINFIQRADVDVIERGGGAGFPNETRLPFGFGQRPSGQELEGDPPLQPLVFGFIDDAHFTRPYVFDQPVAFG